MMRPCVALRGTVKGLMWSICQEGAKSIPHALWLPLLQTNRPTFEKKSQIWHMLVASASETESFNLCLVPNARCVAMSGGIVSVQP